MGVRYTRQNTVCTKAKEAGEGRAAAASQNGSPPWLVLLIWLGVTPQCKGHWFNSLSGRMPGLQVHPGQGKKATNRFFSPYIIN